ncbi:MAG: ACT domain-containing protein [Nanoarchaeota archaeon]
MDVEEYLKHGKVNVWPNLFAVVKASQSMKGAFCTIDDPQEKTVIIEESKIEAKHALSVQKGFRVLTFDMLVPFGMVGFLAKVGRALADEDVSILSYASYSSDHIMVADRDLDRAISALTSLGLQIVRL